MADNARCSLSANILLDEIKSRFSGALDYEPNNSSEKWLYKQHSVPVTPAVICATNDEFLGNLTSSDTIAANDKILWIAIKHSGLATTTGIKTKEGVMINFTGTNPLWNGTNDADTNNMILAPNELIVLKLNGVLTEDLKAGTCILTSGKPSAIGLSTVVIHVAVIIDDVSA